MVTPRDCLLLIIAKGEQLIRKIQTDVNATVEISPMDIERERIILHTARRALAAFDSQDLEEYRRLTSDMSSAEIGFSGVKLNIVRDPILKGRGVFSYAHPNGKQIDLYPDAFSSPETLIRTLGNKPTHMYQFRKLGPSHRYSR